MGNVFNQPRYVRTADDEDSHSEEAPQNQAQVNGDHDITGLSQSTFNPLLLYFGAAQSLFSGTPDDEIFGFGAQTIVEAPTPEYSHADLIASGKVVQAPMKVHKDSLKLVLKGGFYALEFTYDTSLPCSVQIFWMADTQKELPKTGKHYLVNPGMAQAFKQDDAVFDPLLYSKEDLTFTQDSLVFPLVISMNALDAGGNNKVTQLLTLASLHKISENSWEVKTLQQKIHCRGEIFVLHDIFGNEQSPTTSDECVICLSVQRDTLIIPCRHLCVCHQCAQELRRQTNKCPICRGSARAMVRLPFSSETKASEEDTESSEEVVLG